MVIFATSQMYKLALCLVACIVRAMFTIKLGSDIVMGWTYELDNVSVALAQLRDELEGNELSPVMDKAVQADLAAAIADLISLMYRVQLVAKLRD